MSAPHFIAVDWGTSNLRAYLVDRSVQPIAKAQSARGILAVENNAFAEVLKAELEPWISAHGPLPVIMSGMIGSRQGWIEVPYVRCPASVRELADGLAAIEVEGIGTVHIVPGVDYLPEDGPPDVMRGEESQVVGAMTGAKKQSSTFVLPGTHSKWVSTTGSVITGFSTYMTGEIFDALKRHTILGRLMKSATPSGRGFLEGVQAARRGGSAGMLLHRLFSVRTLGLFDLLPAEELSEYMSGLLIGSEISAAARAGQTIIIFGTDELTARYGSAAGALGVSWTRGPADSVVAGQHAIATAAGIFRSQR